MTRRHIRALICVALPLLALWVSACSSSVTATVTQQATSTPAGQPGLPTATSTSATPTNTSTPPTPTDTPAPPSDSFVWTAQAGNISGHVTFIDSPNTNGHPDAILLVTPRYNPNSKYDNHPIGVWYASGKWSIFNQDGVVMPTGASFNVKVYPGASSGVFTWTAVPSSITSNWTTIDNPATNSNPSAVLLATPVYSSTAVYVNHPIGVWYRSIVNKWAVFVQDGTAFPANASLNIVMAVGVGDSVFTHTAGAGTISSNWTTLNNSLLNGHSNAIMLVTPVYSSTAVYVNHNIGAWFNSTTSKWTIFNQDKAAMPSGATFNGVVFGG